MPNISKIQYSIRKLRPMHKSDKNYKRISDYNVRKGYAPLLTVRWLGHVLRMEDDRIPKQAMYWQMESQIRRKPERPTMNWIDTIARDLKSIGIDWDEAEQAVVNRKDWRERVAQCVFDTG